MDSPKTSFVTAVCFGVLLNKFEAGFSEVVPENRTGRQDVWSDPGLVDTSGL